MGERYCLSMASGRCCLRLVDGCGHTRLSQAMEIADPEDVRVVGAHVFEKTIVANGREEKRGDRAAIAGFANDAMEVLVDMFLRCVRIMLICG